MLPFNCSLDSLRRSLVDLCCIFVKGRQEGRKEGKGERERENRWEKVNRATGQNLTPAETRLEILSADQQQSKRRGSFKGHKKIGAPLLSRHVQEKKSRRAHISIKSVGYELALQNSPRNLDAERSANARSPNLLSVQAKPSKLSKTRLYSPSKQKKEELFCNITASKSANR